MAEDKRINVVIRAKSALSAGLAQTKGALMAFSAKMKGLISATLGPVAAVIGAFMLLKKVIGFVQTAMDAKGKLMREDDAARGKQNIEGLATGYERLTAAIKRRNDALKDAQKLADIEQKGVRDQIDAQRELAKQQAIAAIDPNDKEGRTAAAQRFDEVAALEDAKRKTDDLRKAQRNQLDEANQKRADAILLLEQEKKMAAAANAEREKSIKYGQVGSTKAGQIFRGSATLEASKEASKAAEERADELTKMRRKAAAEAAASVADAVQIEKEAAALSGQIIAAETETRALALKQRNEAEATAAEERKKIAEDEAKAKADLLKEQADAEKEAAQQANDAAVKEREGRVAEAQKAVDEQKKLADMTVQDFIDAARAKKDAEKQAAKEIADMAKLQALKDGGRKLTKRQQERLDAFNAIQQAKNQGVGKAQLELKAQQDALVAEQKAGNATLKTIEKNLDESLKKLTELAIQR